MCIKGIEKAVHHQRLVACKDELTCGWRKESKMDVAQGADLGTCVEATDAVQYSGSAGLFARKQAVMSQMLQDKLAASPVLSLRERLITHGNAPDASCSSSVALRLSSSANRSGVMPSSEHGTKCCPVCKIRKDGNDFSSKSLQQCHQLRQARHKVLPCVRIQIRGIMHKSHTLSLSARCVSFRILSFIHQSASHLPSTQHRCEGYLTCRKGVPPQPTACS